MYMGSLTMVKINYSARINEWAILNEAYFDKVDFNCHIQDARRRASSLPLIIIQNKVIDRSKTMKKSRNFI